MMRRDPHGAWEGEGEGKAGAARERRSLGPQGLTAEGEGNGKQRQGGTTMETRGARNRARVLYVDDNPHDVALVQYVLEVEHAEFELIVARSYDDLDQALDRGGFDVAVSDYNVLGHTGLEIVDRIRERMNDVPFVLLTGTGSEEVVVEALRRGVDDYVIKTPTHIRQLPHRLNLLLRKRNLERDRAMALAALMLASASHRALLETSPDAMLVLGDNREIWFANPAAEAMFGAPRGGLVGEVFELPIAEPGQAVDVEIRRGKAGVCLGELRAVSTTWEGKSATLAVIRDVTERSRLLAEQRALARASSILLESESLEEVLAEVLDQLKQVVGADAGYVVRRKEGAHEVLVQDPGSRICAITSTGCGPIRGLRLKAYDIGEPLFENDFPNSPYADFLPSGHIELDNVLFCPVRTPRGIWGLIGLANKPGGFVESDAVVTTAFGRIVALAIERQSYLESLRESESRFRAIFDNAMDGIVLSDMETGRILLANQAMCRLVGYTCQELVRRKLCDVIPTGELPGEQIPLGGGNGEDRAILGEVTIRRSDGQVRHAEVHAVRLGIEGRDVLVGVLRDVTERRQLQAVMAQSDRLATMGMLAAGVAHEINNPLAYLLYNLETAVEDLGKLIGAQGQGDDARDAGEGEGSPDPGLQTREALIGLLEDIYFRVREAETGAQRIRSITRGLGSFSRVEQPERTEIDLVAAVEHAINMARNEIKYRARLVKDLAPVPPVLASEGRLAQVALNLLVNAAQAMEEGDVEHNQIRVRTWASGEGVFLEVSDTGEGIAESDLDKIFEPFFSTKPVGVGSGLGLSICKKIVSECGGEISVSSVRGEGTRFVVRLPRASRRPEDSSGKTEVSPKAPVRGRVLVVDDEPSVRRILQRLLGKHHVVIAVESGEAARALVETDRDFDVILCDVMMSGGSGMEFHRWLREVDEPLARRVVFMSGGAFTPGARDYLGGIENRRIEKPFDMDKLRTLVSELVAAARGVRPPGAPSG